MTDRKKAEVLIRLLDDPDEYIFSSVQKELKSMGAEVLPFLEECWLVSANDILQQRLIAIIDAIQQSELHSLMTQWIETTPEDVLKGAYLIARFQYPDLDFIDIDKQVKKLADDVWLEINNNLTALEKVNIINRVLYDMHGFSANDSNFFSPQNCYINKVLETKKGNAMTLSIIYLSIAQKLELPIRGINLPNNFIVAYMDNGIYGNVFRDNVLFYIDPFCKGTVFGRQEIDQFIRRIKLSPHESFYTPCSNIKIIQRLLSNLIYSYDKSKDRSKIEQLKGLFFIISTKNI